MIPSVEFKVYIIFNDIFNIWFGEDLRRRIPRTFLHVPSPGCGPSPSCTWQWGCSICDGFFPQEACVPWRPSLPGRSGRAVSVPWSRTGPSVVRRPRSNTEQLWRRNLSWREVSFLEEPVASPKLRNENKEWKSKKNKITYKYWNVTLNCFLFVCFDNSETQ